MVVSVKRVLLFVMLVSGAMNQANAGFVLFTDRVAFEAAVGSILSFEGFNDSSLTGVDISTDRNFNPHRTTTSHVSEGDRALSIFESDTMTISFDHEVFAVGFDLNELNSNNLSYSDNAGNSVVDALLVTDVWNESTFFGLVSDTAFTSFSLAGNGDQSVRATYGFDALAYTSPVAAIPTPSSLVMFVTGLLALAGLRSTCTGKRWA